MCVCAVHVHVSVHVCASCLCFHVQSQCTGKCVHAHVSVHVCAHVFMHVLVCTLRGRVWCVQRE